MSLRSIGLCAGFLFTITVFVPSATVGIPFFEGLGTLPEARFGSSAIDISEDGTAVLGNSDEGLNMIAFHWRDGVMTSLGHFPDDPIMLSEASGISADGAVAAGVGISGNGTEGFRWSGGPLVGLGDLAGGFFYSHAFEISGDGNVIVGLSRTDEGDFPFRWEDGVMTNLSEDFDGDAPDGYARSISNDGQVIIGDISTTMGTRMFRWQSGVMEAITNPPGGAVASARSLSADGSVIVGHAAIAPGHVEAFRWEASAYQFLGDLPGGAVDSRAIDVSADGSVIVGVSNGSNGPAPFIWDGAHGMRNLDDVLRLRLKLDLDGWTLSEAVGVSGDGRTIAGKGLNPSGKPEAWIAHVGCALGDFDGSESVDLADYASFADCLGGPSLSPDPGAGGATAQDCIDAFDFDCNEHVDLLDAALLQRVFD